MSKDYEGEWRRSQRNNRQGRSEATPELNKYFAVNKRFSPGLAPGQYNIHCLLSYKTIYKFIFLLIKTLIICFLRLIQVSLNLLSKIHH